MLSKWNVGTNGLSCKSATEAQACVCDGSASVRVCVQTIAPYMQVLIQHWELISWPMKQICHGNLELLFAVSQNSKSAD